MLTQSTIVLDIHRVCNQRCSYCVAHAESRDFGRITHPETLEDLNWLYKTVENANIIFTGGEPLITPNIEAIFEAVAAHGHKISLQSNFRVRAKAVLGQFSPRQFGWILSTFHSIEIKRFPRYLETVSDLRREGYPIVVKLVLDEPMFEHFEAFQDALTQNGAPVILAPLIHFPTNAPAHPHAYTREQWQRIAPRLTLNSSWLYFAGGFRSRNLPCHAGNRLLYATVSNGHIRGCSHGFPATVGNLYDHELTLAPDPIPCGLDCCLCDFHYYCGIIPTADDSTGFASLLANPRQTVSFAAYNAWARQNALTTPLDLEPLLEDASASLRPPQGKEPAPHRLREGQPCTAWPQPQQETPWHESHVRDTAQPLPYCITGTGRCGTMFFAELLSLPKNSVCEHEKHFRHASMMRYFQSHDMNFYMEDIVNRFIPTINKYKTINITYGVSSGHMYFSIPMLHSILNSAIRFVFIVRKPEDFVRSALARGFFDPGHPNYCNQIEPAPNSPIAKKWLSMSPFEKCLWYWNMVNSFLLHQIPKYAKGTCLLLKLEDFDVAGAKDLFAFLGLTPPDDHILESALRRHVNASPGEGHERPNPRSEVKKLGPVTTWTAEQRRLLETYTGKLRQTLYGPWEETSENPGAASPANHGTPAPRPEPPATKIPVIPVERLHVAMGFAVPCDYPLSFLEVPLEKWRMEIHDAPLFRYLYRNFQPKRHLEFGTWQGAGTIYCLEECDASVWTINLPAGEQLPDGRPGYMSTESYDLGAMPASEWARRIGLREDLARQSDTFGFIGRFYLEKGLGHRVCQIYCDSTQWDDGNYPDGFFDSVLIDGGHLTEVVVSDTMKALRLVRPGGLVLWHDFCPPMETVHAAPKGVGQAVTRMSQLLERTMQSFFWIYPSWILCGIRK